MLAVTSASQLARQSLLEQQQERQRSHAAASTSAAGSKEQDAAALAQLADSGQAAGVAWQRIEQQAQQGGQDLVAAGGCTDARPSLLAGAAVQGAYVSQLRLIHR